MRWLLDANTTDANATDANATDAGIDLFYGVEVWPIAPVVVRAQVAGGGVGQAGFGEA